MELPQEGALILAAAAVLHPLPGHLVQGDSHGLGADPLQQTEPVPREEPCPSASGAQVGSPDLARVPASSQPPTQAHSVRNAGKAGSCQGCILPGWPLCLGGDPGAPVYAVCGAIRGQSLIPQK